MKKVLVILVALFGINFAAKAQLDHNHAIGLRLGGSSGFGTEISYQYSLSPMNRLQADLGLRSNSNWNSWMLHGTYQWVWNIDGGFNWYAGAGAGIGSWSEKNDHLGDNDSGLYLTADGIVGVEYNFDIPLQIAIDTRPSLSFVHPSNDVFYMDLALSLRYRF